MTGIALIVCAQYTAHTRKAAVCGSRNRIDGVDLREIEKAAREQGWTVTRTKKGHPVFIPPDPTKERVVGSGTPSDVRAIRNLLARLRRQGLICHGNHEEEVRMSSEWVINVDLSTPIPFGGDDADQLIDGLAAFGPALSYRSDHVGVTLSLSAPSAQAAVDIALTAIARINGRLAVVRVEAETALVEV